eukprot:TRINITY_DN3081_c0_g1_i2.p1 TRINITY_DN3081_c0_g1~~TRINITY_DN3081_c0_g1_i2.p1  ORF type:complete len:385 (-),score=36.27 TRINITY_DN3081_c0_g1_i2:2-1156(-)
MCIRDRSTWGQQQKMESEQNLSRVVISFGEDIPSDAPKSELHAVVKLSRDKADQQTAALEQLTNGNFDKDTSLVINFKVKAEHSNQFSQALTSILTHESHTIFGLNKLSARIKSGAVRYTVSTNENGVVLVLNLGTPAKTAFEQFKFFLGMGFEDLVATEDTTFTITAHSNNSFKDISEFRKNESFGAALLKNFKLEVKLLNNPGFFECLIRLLTLMDAHGAINSKIEYLALFGGLDFNLRFRSTDNLPDGLGKLFLERANGVDTIKLTTIQNEIMVIRDTLDSEAELSFVITGYVAVNIKFRLPGLSEYILTHKVQKNVKFFLVLPCIQGEQASVFGPFTSVSFRLINKLNLSLIHISEPTRRTPISYAVFCLKKKKLIHPCA